MLTYHRFAFDKISGQRDVLKVVGSNLSLIEKRKRTP